MLLDTTMPIIITTPMRDITLIVVPDTHSISATPIRPVGMASRISSGSRKDWNCATRIRYTSTTARMRPKPKVLKESFMFPTLPRTLIRAPVGTLVSARIFSTPFITWDTSSPTGATNRLMMRRIWWCVISVGASMGSRCATASRRTDFSIPGPRMGMAWSMSKSFTYPSGY